MSASAAPAEAVPRTMPLWLTLVLATACGLLVANLYYAQPLTGPI
ncbi:MFS transporter, partial [Roseomonas ludipueritiae]|nr:MFS transporter [Pseudoroseomonas ludipueritiae]